MSEDRQQQRLWWVFGLRQKLPAGAAWQEAVATVLSEGMHQLGSRGKTSEAEEGLGIDNSCYFYLFRTEQEFGYVVFLSVPARDAWNEDDGGACPFDTGGLWYGRVVTEPPLQSRGEKQEFFQAHNAPLGACAERFWSYLAANYRAPSDYVDGAPPNQGMTQGNTTIVCRLPNTARAWTWEVRVVRRRMPGSTQIENLIWSEEQSRAFDVWMRDKSRLPLASKLRLKQLLKRVTVFAPEGESSSLAAAARLKQYLGS